MKKKHLISLLVIMLLSILRIYYLYEKSNKIEMISYKIKDVINTIDGKHIKLIKYELIDSIVGQETENEMYNKELKDIIDNNFVIKLTYKTNSSKFIENDYYKFNNNHALIFYGYNKENQNDIFEVYVYYNKNMYLIDKTNDANINLCIPIPKNLSPPNVIFYIMLNKIDS